MNSTETTLLRAVQYADQIAEVLACMSGTTAEGRRARKLGEELHERMELALVGTAKRDAGKPSNLKEH